jgi:hypothetical protein
LESKKAVRTYDLDSSPDSSIGECFSVIFDFFLFFQLFFQFFAFSQFHCELCFPNLKHEKQVESVKRGPGKRDKYVKCPIQKEENNKPQREKKVLRHMANSLPKHINCACSYSHSLEYTKHDLNLSSSLYLSSLSLYLFPTLSLFLYICHSLTLSPHLLFVAELFLDEKEGVLRGHLPLLALALGVL